MRLTKNFNYIVPIFNKEDVLERTLEGIHSCAQDSESKFILVVDGCTDNSESIVDEFIKNSSFRAEKIIMPNVHMLLSVNAGLERVTSGFSIIMQDDIVLTETDFERYLYDLYSRRTKTGVVSLRYASNIEPTPLIDRIKLGTTKGMIMETDLIRGPSDYNSNIIRGDYYNFYPRMSAINGPNCIPWEVLSRIGKFDSNLAPYGFDDPEFCLRALKAGFTNGLFPLNYISEEDWGGTRRSKSFLNEVAKIHKRNRIYVYKKHRKFIEEFLSQKDLNRGIRTE